VNDYLDYDGITQ